MIESQAGSHVRIEIKFARMTWGIGQRSLTLTLKVPRESNLDLHTGDGSITVNGTKGDLKLNTGDGSIEVTGADGRLTASTGDGSVRVEGRFDMLDLHTGDGSVEAAATPGSATDSSWSVRTGDGPITLKLPADARATIDALYRGDGAISLDLPVTVSGPVRRTEVRGTLNGGGGVVTLRTGDGSIHLQKY